MKTRALSKALVALPKARGPFVVTTGAVVVGMATTAWAVGRRDLMQQSSSWGRGASVVCVVGG